MAPRIPKTVTNDIFTRLNNAMVTGNSLSDFEFMSLLNKAQKLTVPDRYTCLATLYCHDFKYQLAIENAQNCLNNNQNNERCIVNAVAALNNAALLNDIISISKRHLDLLRYEEYRHIIYDAALYTLDLDYCDSIVSQYPMPNDPERFFHKELRVFFNHDTELLFKGREYLLFALDCLTAVLKRNLKRTSSTHFGLVYDSVGAALELRINFRYISIDELIDIEDEWHLLISEFIVSDNELCDISFSMGIDS